MELSVRFVGLDQLIDAVRKAPDAVREVLDVSVLEAAEIIREDAQSVHRYKTRFGALDRSVIARQTGPAQAEIRLDSAIAPYAVYVHEGTRAHVIEPVKRKALWFETRGGTFRFARGVEHPGTKADRFLYESAERNRARVESRIQAGVNAAIQEAGL